MRTIFPVSYQIKGVESAVRTKALGTQRRTKKNQQQQTGPYQPFEVSDTLQEF